MTTAAGSSLPTFRVLGPLSILTAGGYVPLPGSRAATRLAALLTSPGALASDDFLVRVVWGEESDVEPRGALRTATARLRKLLAGLGLDPGLVSRVAGGMRLVVGPGEVDLLCFRSQVVEAEGARTTAGQVAAMRQALGLWAGPILCNVDSSVLHRGVVPMIEEERLEAHSRIADLLVRENDLKSALAELRPLCAAQPSNENLALQLAEVLHRLGRRQQALAECQRIKAYLRDELGLDPSESLSRLEMQVLSGQVVTHENAVLSRPVPTQTPEPPHEDAPEETTRARPSRIELPVAVPVFVHQVHPVLSAGGFAGRHEDVALVMGRLLAGPSCPLVVITGPLGIGKTALAAHVTASLTGSFPEGAAYVRCRDDLGRSRTVEDLVTEASAPSSTCQHGASGGPLLVLDDAASARVVAAVLGRTRPRAVLVTSSAPLPGLALTHGALTRRLGRLDLPDSLGLLANAIGAERVATDLVAATRIVDTCHGSPLALRALASHAASRPDWSLEEVATWLSSDPIGQLSQDSLQELALLPRFRQGLARLSPIQAELFIALVAEGSPALDLAAHQPPLIAVPRLRASRFSESDVAAAFDGSALPVLAELVLLGWIDETAPGVYRVDPLLAACGQAHVLSLGLLRHSRGAAPPRRTRVQASSSTPPLSLPLLQEAGL